MKNNADDFMDKVAKDIITDAEKREFETNVPFMVKELKMIYDEMKKQEFDDDKAYDFAKSIILGR